MSLKYPKTQWNGDGTHQIKPPESNCCDNNLDLDGLYVDLLLPAPAFVVKKPSNVGAVRTQIILEYNRKLELIFFAT